MFIPEINSIYIELDRLRGEGKGSIFSAGYTKAYKTSTYEDLLKKDKALIAALTHKNSSLAHNRAKDKALASEDYEKFREGLRVAHLESERATIAYYHLKDRADFLQEKIRVYQSHLKLR